MIAHLNGTLIERTPSRVILDVGGVGYEVLVSVATFAQLPQLGERCTLAIYTNVREDAIQLFGFAGAREKGLFEKLITVSGIGPKLAQSILSGVTPEDLAAAIRQSNLARLTAIPGIGKKTAERVVVELRDKLAAEPEAGAAAPASAVTGAAEDVLSALVNLGYSQPVAEKAVQRALNRTPEAGFDRLFKECMKLIGG